MKNFLAAVFVLSFIVFASVASADCDCGTLQVSTSNGHSIFLLEQGAGAIPMTANKKFGDQLEDLAGQWVCLNVVVTATQPGGDTLEATSFCSAD